MKRFIYTSVFILLICSFAFGQVDESKKQIKCPSIKLIDPPATVAPGETMTFSLKIIGEYDKEKLKFKWAVDKGKIISGQGTDSINVSTDELYDEVLTATAHVMGLLGGCASNFSETGIVVLPVPVCNSPLDEFGDLPDEDVSKRIDLLLIELQNNPNSTGYIVNDGLPKDVSKREKLIRKRMKFRKFDESRIIFQYKSVEPKKIRTRYWIIPEGGDFPKID